MKTWRRLGVACSVWAACAGVAGAVPEGLSVGGTNSTVTIHLAPAGNDARGEGTMGAPYATLARAREAVRVRRQEHAGARVEVVLAPGDYVLRESFAMGAEDGGTSEAPVVYRASEPGAARLLGGRILEGFAPVADAAVLARLTPDAQSHVKVVDLAAAGIGDVGALTSRGFARPITPSHAELFYGGRPLTVAQWPNAGSYVRIQGVVSAQSNEWGDAVGELAAGFRFRAPRLERWQASDDWWVHGYWCWDWANSYEHVARLDTADGTIVTFPPHGQYAFRTGQRFCFLNVLEELDAPGEYYLDRTAGRLYVWLPDERAGAEALLSMLESPLIRADHVKHAEFRGLVLEGGRGSGLEIHGGSHVHVEACTIRNMGNRGVWIDGGSDHAVRACEIGYTGDSAVEVSGGDRRTLTRANHTIEDCHLHHVARWTRTYQTGVNASGCGLRMAHNLIHDAPHTAILFWGNDITIEANEIYRVCLETGDAGALYTGRDYTFRGNRILDNFIHHMGRLGGKMMGTCAIYMDDCVSGHEIAGNVVWGGDAVWLGGGRDHLIRDNVFVDCAKGVSMDARGVDPNPVWSNMVHTTMRLRLEDMNWKQPPYATRFPELAPLAAYLDAGMGVPPEHNVCLRNLGKPALRQRWDGKPVEPAWLDESGGVEDPAPGFEDPAWGDFRLKPDAPVRALGIRAPALATVGPRPGTYASSPRVRSRLELSALQDSVAAVRLGLRNEGDCVAAGVMVLGAARVPYALAPGETRDWALTIPLRAGPQTIGAYDETGTARPTQLSVTGAGPALMVRAAPGADVGPDVLVGDPLQDSGLVAEPPCSYRVQATWSPEALHVVVDRGDPTPLTSRVDPDLNPDDGWSSDSLQIRVQTDRVVSYTIWPVTARQLIAVQRQEGTAADAAAGERQVFVGKSGTAIGPGIVVTQVARPDGTGYREEVQIPWSALYRDPPVAAAGMAFRLGVQLIWGDETGAAMLAGVDLNRDPAAPGASFPRSPAAWRVVALQP